MFYSQYTLHELDEKKFQGFQYMFIWSLVYIGLIRPYYKTDFKEIKNISSKRNRKKIYKHYTYKTIQKDRNIHWSKKIVDSLIRGLYNSVNLRNTFNIYIDTVIYDKIKNICKWTIIIYLCIICLIFLIIGILGIIECIKILLNY